MASFLVCPLHRDSLELTIPLVGHTRIDMGHLVSPKEQRPPTLNIALEAHNTIDQLKHRSSQNCSRRRDSTAGKRRRQSS